MHLDSYVLQYNGDDTVIYMFPEQRSRTLRDHYAINFKTLEQDGLLLHSEGVQGDVVTLELKRGRLHLHISLGEIPAKKESIQTGPKLVQSIQSGPNSSGGERSTQVILYVSKSSNSTHC